MVHEQIMRLLSTQEQQDLRMSEAFSHFSGINPLQYNPYTMPLWKGAVAQFDRGLEQAEKKIAGKLRSQIRGLESNPQQLLREFERYRELVKRPGLAKEVSTERCITLHYIRYIISQCQLHLTINTFVTDHHHHHYLIRKCPCFPR